MMKILRRTFHSIAIVSMFILGIVALFTGVGGVARWKDLSRGTDAYYAVSLAAGLGLLSFALLAIAVRKRTPLAWGGVVAALALGVNQFLGLHWSTILCSSPG